jgi:hypothetical protein
MPAVDDHYPPVPPVAKKGRGAASNPSGRFEAQSREAHDDGWDSLAELPDSVVTQLHLDMAK